MNKLLILNGQFSTSNAQDIDRYADNIFKYIYSYKILVFDSNIMCFKSRINNKPMLPQIMTWRQLGAYTYVYTSRPQYVC